MLISGWEAVDGCWRSLRPIAYVLQYMFMSGTTFPNARFPEFSSLSTLTQAVLEMIAPLLSDWPAWHSKGASSSSWAFSIWRWYCPVKETDREINHLCDTLCCDKDLLMKNMFKKKLHSLVEWYMRHCLVQTSTPCRSPISFLWIFNSVWIMGNFSWGNLWKLTINAVCSAAYWYFNFKTEI